VYSAQPSDRPTFRRCLPALVQLHRNWAGGGKVGAARAALIARTSACGGGDGGASGACVPPSSALRELAMQLHCLVLSARLDAAHAPLHDEASECLYSCLRDEAQVACAATSAGGAATQRALAEAMASSTHALAIRCLRAETWLSGEVVAKLAAELAASDLSDQPSFLTGLAQLASDHGTLKAEAERSASGF
jgi:hypothetical protein